MRRIAILAVGIALLLPSAALGQSSTCQAYNGETCPVLTNRPPSDAGTPTSTTSNTTVTQAPVRSSGTLPFTGIDVVLLVVGGGVLLSAGFMVRRFSHRLN
jgi:hypothetical protein